MIHVMLTQEFILGLDDEETRVHENKSEAFPPRHYTMIKPTSEIIQRWVWLHQNKKKNVRLKISCIIGIQQLSKKYFSS